MIRRRYLAAASVLLGFLAAPAHAAVTGPALAATFGPDGRLWRAVPTESWLEVDYSTDHGATFSTPVRVNPRRQRMRAVPEDRPAIAVDADGLVFVTWAADARQPWTRFIAWSADSGRSFSRPLPVSDAADRLTQNQTVVQAAGKRAATVFWLDSRNERPGVAALVIGGFSADQWATPRSAALYDAMCECCRLAVRPAPDGGWAVFGRMVFAGSIRDMGLVQIAPDGRPTVRRVTDDGWVIEACPEHGPALAIGAGGRYHLTWFTLGARRQGIFYAHSDDDGNSTSAPLAIGSTERLAGHADVGALGAVVAVAWQQYDGRRTSIHAMLSRDHGDSWESARELASSGAAADYPFVLSDGNGLYVSWYAADSGYHLYALTAAARP
jgi:hypothetical protein